MLIAFDIESSHRYGTLLYEYWQKRQQLSYGKGKLGLAKTLYIHIDLSICICTCMCPMISERDMNGESVTFEPFISMHFAIEILYHQRDLCIGFSDDH